VDPNRDLFTYDTPGGVISGSESLCFILPPDEIGSLLFAFNPCLEDGIRTFLVQLMIPCMPPTRIFAHSAMNIH
jgi:hypothetical protein